jgi:hypothetical protein
VEAAALMLARKDRMVRSKSTAMERAFDRRGPERYADEGGPLPPAETILEIRRLFAEITAGNDHEDLVYMLNALVQNREALQQAVIVWVDLIEVLVQSAEGRYGAVGRGDLKKDEVKAVVVYLLRTGKFRIPNVPDYLQPVVVDVVADISVDAVVAVANQRGLWVEPPRTARPTWHELRRRFLRGIRRVVGFVLEPFGRLAAAIVMALRYPVRLSPALRQALEAIEREGMIADHQSLLQRITDLKIWIGNNAGSVIAGVQLVDLVVDEAEAFGDLTGPEKKDYARELVLAVLEDLGFDVRGRFTGMKLEMAIDMAIDSLVHTLHKRGVFTHHAPQPRRLQPRSRLA